VLRGAGIGLRNPHMSEVLRDKPAVPWFEIISDNFMSRGEGALGGIDRHRLFAIRERYPISLHGVGMSLGSVDALDQAYLKALKTLATDLECRWISEHAAFVSVGQKHYHDLLPLPYTEEALIHLSERVMQVQEYLGQALLVENATNYIQCKHSTMSDGEFMSELVARSGCHLLVDMNNLYVNQHNHGWSALDFLNTVPADSVKEIHLAGFSENARLLIDSHSSPVAEPVWALYEEALLRFGATPTLIEWDNNIPEFGTLLQQAWQAESYLSLSLELAREA
jgi:uncharacterized protein (UPF0276 family)